MSIKLILLSWLFEIHSLRSVSPEERKMCPRLNINLHRTHETARSSNNTIRNTVSSQLMNVCVPVPFSCVIRLSPLFLPHRLHTRLQQVLILIIATRTTKRGLTTAEGNQCVRGWMEMRKEKDEKTKYIKTFHFPGIMNGLNGLCYPRDSLLLSLSIKCGCVYSPQTSLHLFGHSILFN